jgi:hypothetical protein
MSNRPRNRTIKKQKRCLSTAEAAAAGSSCAPPCDRWGSRGGKEESSQARLRSCHRRSRRSSCRRSLQSNYEEKCRCPSPLSKAHPRCIPHTLVSAAKQPYSAVLLHVLEEAKATGAPPLISEYTNYVRQQRGGGGGGVMVVVEAEE